MRKRLKKARRRILALMLSILTFVTTIAASSAVAYAADGTLTFNSGETLAYGDYFTTRMSFDGSNVAYCVEPLKKTPNAGTYQYNLLGNDSPVRKALYYLPGGYGYDGNIKNQYLGGWSEDNAYVIGHLVAAYIYAGYDAGSGAFYGAPQSYIDKAVEVTGAINSLPAPPESFRAFIVPAQDNQTIAGSWYQKPYGWIELYKFSANAAVSDGNGNYDIAGAQYGIYRGSELVETLTTNQDGYAKSKELEADTVYTVRELKASPGFIVDVNSYEVTVKSETGAPLEVKEIPQNNPLDVVLRKLDKENRTNLPQGGATLKDAEFTVRFYGSQSDTDPAADGETPLRTWVFQTDSSGGIHFSRDYLVSGDELYYASDGKTACLPLGTVTIQESKAPTGYFASETVFVQRITGGGDAETLAVYNAPEVEEQIFRGGVKIQKRDIETLKAEAQGGATLEHAEFTITTLNENPVLVDGKSYTKDQVVMTIETDGSGIASTGKDTLPYGHYRVDEVTPPEGYLNSGKISVEFDIVEDGKIVELIAEDNSICNQVIRGDLEFVKVSDGDLNRLANVPFSITSNTTKESHVIVTDKNGYANTSAEWNQHTANTNRGETAEDGIWFGSSAPDDSKGALIYDTYTIEEQRCKTNEGMNLLKFEATVYKDKVTIDLGTLTDDHIDIYTTAKDKDTGSHFSKPGEKVTLVDTVEYEGVKKGQEYKLIGTLMDKETGEPLLIDGEQVTSETTFKAKKSSGSVEVKFVFDAGGLEGKTIVVFEELYHEGLKLAVHADIEDTDQTIYFPAVKTTARDADTGVNIAHADEEVTLIDTVSYSNLIPGETYTVTGVLMDKKTGKEIEVAGKSVTAKTEFTAEDSFGTVDVEFVFDGSALKGKSTVVFESISYEGKEIAAHADIEDKEQTIYFPSIQTTATDKADGNKELTAGEKAVIADTVAYTNLVPGQKYKVSGILMDKETGKELLVDGKPVTAEAAFTPEKASGTVEVTFAFDSSALAGKSLVVFEKLYYVDGDTEIPIGVHEEIEDEGQTVKVVEEGTPETPAPPAPTTSTGTPKTGDETHLEWWAALAAAALAGLVILGIAAKRKKKKK